jgi:hypothetical protein
LATLDVAVFGRKMLIKNSCCLLLTASNGQGGESDRGWLAMGSIARLTTACSIALIVACLFSIGQLGSAQAQGGIVCAYGPKKYRDCCKQSFKEHRRLKARARARDIEACMDSKAASEEAPASDSKSKETRVDDSKSKGTLVKDSKPKDTSVKEATPKEAPREEPPTREKSAQSSKAKSGPAEFGNLKDLGKLK